MALYDLGLLVFSHVVSHITGLRYTLSRAILQTEGFKCLPVPSISSGMGSWTPLILISLVCVRDHLKHGCYTFHFKLHISIYSYLWSILIIALPKQQPVEKQSQRHLHFSFRRSRPGVWYLASEKDMFQRPKEAQTDESTILGKWRTAFSFLFCYSICVSMVMVTDQATSDLERGLLTPLSRGKRSVCGRMG